MKRSRKGVEHSITSAPAIAHLAHSFVSGEPTYFKVKGGKRAEVIVRGIQRGRGSSSMLTAVGQLTSFNNEPINPGTFKAEFNPANNRGRLVIRR